MSKILGNLDTTVRIIFLVLLALLMFTPFIGIVLVFFVPVIGWYLWSLRDQNKELEARVAALEGKKPDKPKP